MSDEKLRWQPTLTRQLPVPRDDDVLSIMHRFAPRILLKFEGVNILFDFELTESNLNYTINLQT